MTARRRPTATSPFGVGRREAHDASAFYERFTLPEISSDATVNVPSPEVLDRIHCKDARDMSEIASSSVALVVTSPPYFAGKEYEEALGRGHVPGTYVEYLSMLTDVFSECARALEAGGRIAVNVANLGRKPYRSLTADVISILQDRLGLLLRGEVVWIKGQGAAGSCAWGSFQSPANPVLRDLSERVVIASKGRFDRARTRRERERAGLPFAASIFKDEFLEATTDVWELSSESARRVGHPAPFPVELPARLIELYTYEKDLVLDPFMGSGSTAVAALRGGRHFIGYDTDAGYVAAATRRAEQEMDALALGDAGRQRVDVGNGERAREAFGERRSAKEIARALIADAGFVSVLEEPRLAAGIEIDFEARDRRGNRWLFAVCGGLTVARGGLRRSETLWKALGTAAVLRASDSGELRLLLLATDLPARNTASDAALRATRGILFEDVLVLTSPNAAHRLNRYAAGDDAVDA